MASSNARVWAKSIRVRGRILFGVEYLGNAENQGGREHAWSLNDVVFPGIGREALLYPDRNGERRIVLNASEEGSCLPGWRPVQQQGPIRLYISPNHSGLYQASPDRVSHQGCRLVNIQFLHQSSAM